MYTLYTDKSEDFKCNIGVEGANISDTQARLVLKSDTINLMFEGKVSSNGDCTIPIKKLKKLLSEGTTGDIKLEVIAEDTFFSPWEDEFEVKTNKKVTVEVQNGNAKETIKESRIRVKVTAPQKVTQPKHVEKASLSEVNHGHILAQLLGKKGINLDNLTENVSTVSNLTEKYINKYKVKESQDSLITEIINQLK
jgi:hypothetical protein